MATRARLLSIVILILAGSLLPIISVQGYNVPNQAKYLVAFFEFEDLTHTRSVDELRTVVESEVQSYYSEVSYGKLTLTAQILPNWITLPLKVQGMKVFEWNFNEADMQKVDGFARSRLAQLGIAALQYVIIFVVYAGKVWGHAHVSWGMAFENEFHGSGIFCHELGHALGRLPDLYSYNLAKEGKPDSVWVGPWDIMGWTSGGFSSWSLIRLGWIGKNQIVDIRERVQKIFTIDALENRSARFYVARIHLPSTNFAYYVEVRKTWAWTDPSLSLAF